MKIPDNIYMNICKVFQELYKNKFVPNELNIAEVGSRGKNMTCRYRITVPEEMESVTFPTKTRLFMMRTTPCTEQTVPNLR